MLLSRGMWIKTVRRSQVQLTPQSRKKLTTATERTLKVTHDPRTYSTTRSNGGNNGDDDATTRGNTHPTTSANAHKYTTQGKFPHVNCVSVVPRTNTTTQRNDDSTQAINGSGVTQREQTHRTTCRNADLSTTQGSILHVEGVNATPPTNTKTKSNADFTQPGNGGEASPHDNTTAPWDTEATKATICGSSPSSTIDGCVGSQCIFLFLSCASISLAAKLLC